MFGFFPSDHPVPAPLSLSQSNPCTDNHWNVLCLDKSASISSALSSPSSTRKSCLPSDPALAQSREIKEVLGWLLGSHYCWLIISAQVWSLNSFTCGHRPHPTSTSFIWVSMFSAQGPLSFHLHFPVFLEHQLLPGKVSCSQTSHSNTTHTHTRKFLKSPSEVVHVTKEIEVTSWGLV